MKKKICKKCVNFNKKKNYCDVFLKKVKKVKMSDDICDFYETEEDLKKAEKETQSKKYKEYHTLMVEFMLILRGIINTDVNIQKFVKENSLEKEENPF